MPKFTRSLKALSKVKSFKIMGITIHLSDELDIDTDNLSEEFETQPKRVGFWRNKRSRALAKIQRVESEFEELEATRFIQYKNLYDEQNEVYTDFLLKQEVRCDEKIISKREELLIAKKEFHLIDALCVAYEHRKSSLINLGMENRDDRPLSV